MSDGNYIGNTNTLSTVSLSGVWDLRSQIQNLNKNKWPSISNDQFFNNVSLLLHGDGENNGVIFTDSSLSARTITPFGNAKTATDVKLFGTASMAFDGTGDYLSTVDTANLNFEAGNFTIEFWINFNNTIGSSFPRILTKGNFQLSATAWGILMTRSTGVISFNTGNPDVPLIIGTLTPNVWTHIAVTRFNTNLSGFFNGVKTAVGTNSVNYVSTFPVAIAASNTGTDTFGGYIDDLRITKGVARYTENFLIPSGPYPDN
jgi:hypothetical protein